MAWFTLQQARIIVKVLGVTKALVAIYLLYVCNREETKLVSKFYS